MFHDVAVVKKHVALGRNEVTKRRRRGGHNGRLLRPEQLIAQCSKGANDGEPLQRNR